MSMVEQNREQQRSSGEIVEKHRLEVVKLWGEYLEDITPNEAVEQLLKDGAKLGWWDASLHIHPQEGIIRYRGFVFSRDRQELTRPDGTMVTLAPTEADLFDLLISNPGRLVPKSAIRKVLTARSIKINEKDGSIRTYMGLLRKKINDKLLPQEQQYGLSRIRWQFINSVYKGGYFFNPNPYKESEA